MNWIYWISSSIISAFLLLSSYSYIFSKSTIEGVAELGFPDFFRIQLAVLKIFSSILILIPKISIQVKEWCYAGVGLFLITALVAHIANKDSVVISLVLIVLLIILGISNYTMNHTV